jgi:small subunit ribosomal protein S15
MIKKTAKERIVKKFQTGKTDTGSAQVQIALLTREVKELSSHLKKHPKDDHSRRGLLKMVAKRRKLLVYLASNNERAYLKVIKELKLKK